MDSLPNKAGQIIRTTRVTVRQKTVEMGGVHWTLFQVGAKRYMTHHRVVPGEKVEAWPEKLRRANYKNREIPDIYST